MFMKFVAINPSDQEDVTVILETEQIQHPPIPGDIFHHDMRLYEIVARSWKTKDEEHRGLPCLALLMLQRAGTPLIWLKKTKVIVPGPKSMRM